MRSKKLAIIAAVIGVILVLNAYIPKYVEFKNVGMRSTEISRKKHLDEGYNVSLGHRLLTKPKAPEYCIIAQVDRRISFEFHNENGQSELLDRISASSFKSVAEVIYGNPIPSSKPPHLHFTLLTQELIPCLQPGVIIHVENMWLHQFRYQILEFIKVPFILISGDTDDPAPGPYASILDSPFIIHWYAQNCDFNLQQGLHAGRYSCIPLGNSQWNGHGETMEKVFKKLELFSPEHHLRKGKLVKREKLLLGSFAESTNPEARKPAKERLKKLPFATFKYDKTVDRGIIYEMIHQFQFVVSPHGVGLDCYRTWEALYLGCAVIVKTSTLDSIYKDLPVLILQDWSELTEEKLKATWDEFKSRTFDYSPLFQGHWERMFYPNRTFTLDGENYYTRNYYATQIKGTGYSI